MWVMSFFLAFVRMYIRCCMRKKCIESVIYDIYDVRSTDYTDISDNATIIEKKGIYYKCQSVVKEVREVISRYAL